MRFFKAAILAGTVAVFAATLGFCRRRQDRLHRQAAGRAVVPGRMEVRRPVAAKEKGFTLVKIGAEDGEKVQSAIDNLGAQGAQGFIICTPDVKLGPGIVAKAAANDLKLMTVDDRLVSADGKPLEDVPHMGISATKIGEAVGQAIVDEIKKRGWKT